METMDWLIQMINNVGTPIAILVYFIWRDAKFMDKLDKSLDVIMSFIRETKGEN